MTGELVGAIAMTEPGVDRTSEHTTTALKDGNGYVQQGKTYISNSQTADFIIVVARPIQTSAPRASL